MIRHATLLSDEDVVIMLFDKAGGRDSEILGSKRMIDLNSMAFGCPPTGLTNWDGMLLALIDQSLDPVTAP